MRLLYQSLFEIRLCTAKEGGMAVSAVWRLAYLIAPFPLGTKSQAKEHRRCLRIGETHWAPLLKSKNKLLLVL